MRTLSTACSLAVLGRRQVVPYVRRGRARKQKKMRRAGDLSAYAKEMRHNASKGTRMEKKDMD